MTDNTQAKTEELTEAESTGIEVAAEASPEPEVEEQPTEEAEPETAESETASQIEAYEKTITNLREQIQESTARFLRARADLENFKKRAEKEKKDTVKFANKQIFLQTLEVLDNFERALAAVEDPSDNFVVGVEMIKKQLQEVLTQNGVEEIDAADKDFDPYLHEAIAKEPSDEYGENKVMEVFQKGFRFHGTLLRPAKVKVAVAPEEPETSETASDEEE